MRSWVGGWLDHGDLDRSPAVEGERQHLAVVDDADARWAVINADIGIAKAGADIRADHAVAVEVVIDVGEDAGGFEVALAICHDGANGRAKLGRGARQHGGVDAVDDRSGDVYAAMGVHVGLAVDKFQTAAEAVFIEAAELAGIKVKWVTVKMFALMGALCAIAAAISTARLNAATNAQGTLDELYTIAAAVIGGTSLAGGVGTIAGAMLGAIVMQSLNSGMVLLGLDTPLQSIVILIVLVVAVWLDTVYRSRAK